MPIDIPTGLIVPTQEPLDAKRYALTLAGLADLGDDDYLAFAYYAGMVVMCLEDVSHYIWLERPTGYIQPGLIPDDFPYPPGSIANGVDYSNKNYNFFRYSDIHSFLNPGFAFRYRIGAYKPMDKDYTPLPGDWEPDVFGLGGGYPIRFKYKINLFYTEGERLILTTVQLKHNDGTIVWSIVDDLVLLPAYPGEFESQTWDIFETEADLDLNETYTFIIESKTQDGLILSSHEAPFRITG